MEMQRKPQRASTQDRAPPDYGTADSAYVHPVMQIGPRRRMLPDGTLLCEGVPIARTGTLLYWDGEVPLQADPLTKRIYVERSPEELFSEATISSFMGSPIINEHPGDEMGVTRENWKQMAGGFATTNVRQGTGAGADLLLADLVVTNKNFIRDIMSGKCEVSAGYDASYRQAGIGQGLQYDIIGNHIALVERGRCGPRCVIGDHATTQEEEEIPMTTQATPARRRLDPATLQTLNAAQAALTAFGAGAADEADEQGGVHVHVHTTDSAGRQPTPTATPGAEEDRLTKLEKTVGTMSEQLGAFLAAAAAPGARAATADAATAQAAAAAAAAGDDEKDPATGKVMDSAALATSYQDVTARCEILVPGFRVATFDAALPRKRTVDAMCSLRKRALTAYASTTDGAAALQGIAGSEPDVEKMDCASAAILFNAATSAKAQANNRAATGDGARLPNGQQEQAPATLAVQDRIAAMQDANAKFWASQNGGSST